MTAAEDAPTESQPALPPDREPPVPDVWGTVRAFAEREFAGFEPRSVLAILHAGCSSPSAIHRLPSLTGLWMACLAGPPCGTREAAPADLERWVSQVRELVPEFAQVEDWVPSDPRLSVHVAFRGGFWPVHPGVLGWPTQVVELVERWARALDSQAVARLGFGLGDLLDVTLRIIARERLRVSGTWSEERPLDPSEPARVGRSEVGAVWDLLEGWGEARPGGPLPSMLTGFPPAGSDEGADPGFRSRLERALQFASVAAGELLPGAGFAAHSVTALAVDCGDRLVPVPAGVALEGLAALVPQAVRALAESYHGEGAEEKLAELEAALAHQGEQVLADSVENLLAHRILVSVDGAEGRYWLLCPAARHLVVVAVAAGLNAGRVDAAVARASGGLALVADGARMVNVGSLLYTPPPLPPEQLAFDAQLLSVDGSGRLAADTVVTRVILIEGARAPRYEWSAGTVQLSIDEWRFITGSVRDPEQLWAFLDELSQVPGAQVLQAFDVLDLWTAFRRDGGLGAGLGAQIVACYPPQDALDAQWLRAAEWDAVESVVRGWGLPGVQAWPGRALDEQGQAELWSLARSAHLFVDSDAGFGVVIGDEEKTVDARFAAQLAEELYQGLHRMAHAAKASEDTPPARGWAAWSRTAGDSALLVSLVGVRDGQPDPAQLRAVAPPDEVVVLYDEDQLKHLDAAGMHRWLGCALGDGVLALAAASRVTEQPVEQVADTREIARAFPDADRERAAFVEGWNAVPASLRTLYYSGPSARATTVVSAATLGDGARYRALRRIAAQIDRHGIGPQEQCGPGAVALLPELCQAAEEALEQELAGYDGRQAVLAAADEVERFWELRSYNEQMRATGMDAEPLSRAALQVDETITGRAGDLLLETLLCRPPHGPVRLDHRDWAWLIHLAAECLHLRDNLDAARCGLLSLTVRVLHGGGVWIEQGEELMDLPRHQAERAAISDSAIGELIEEVALPRVEQGKNPFSSLRHALEQEAATAVGWDERQEARLLLAVDDAMLQHMGTGQDALLAVLLSAAAWPVPGDPVALTAAVPAQELIDNAAQWSGLERRQIAAAVEWLTLTPARLTAQQVRRGTVEGRDARLLIRPLIAVDPDGAQLLVLPRRAAATRRVFGNYLSNGRLPWPERGLPEPVLAAARAWRAHRTARFERAVDRRFDELGVALRRPSLKPNKAAALGLELTRELDLLALEPVRRIIWVVEAKDQHVPFEPASLVKEVVDFLGAERDAPVRAVAPHAKSPQQAFLGKLLDNSRQVELQKAAVLAAFGLDPADAANWRVRPLIVTPRPCAAAAVADTGVQFATPGTLADIVGERASGLR